MKFYYNPLDKTCKSLIGAFPRKSVIAFNVYKYREFSGEEDFSAENCNLICFRDGQPPVYYPMETTDSGWTLSLKFHETGLFFYYFKIGGVYLSCGAFREGELLNANPVAWQLTVYDERYSTPEWFKGGIMYQIFPDRFYRSEENAQPVPEGKIMRKWGEVPYFRPDQNGKVLNNDFFGGNLNGVREKLDYLRSLGVTVIYFNPIFEAFSNHRYDTADYKKIDPLLGTEEEFDRLVSEAEQKGIRIILDGVFNHTGADSRYFNKNGRYRDVGAYQSKQSPYADWYTFRSFPNLYDSWWGIETLPAINENSSSYQEFILGRDGVLKFWLRHGIGGYRLDVADELPDFFVKKLRSAVKEENPEALILGEVWEDASNKIAYGERREYFQGYELDSVMNYPLKDAIIDYIKSGNLVQLRTTIAMLIDNYPKTVLDSMMNILGTHDTERIITALGGKTCHNKEEMSVTVLTEREKTEALYKVKMAAVLQYTLPGVPCIYYGDEIGMEGYIDPFCRRCYDWEHSENDLVTFYQKLGEIRRKKLKHAFRDGTYREIYTDGTCLVFERKSRQETAYVYVNNSNHRYKITFQGRFREHLSGSIFDGDLTVRERSFGIISRSE